MKTLPLLLTLSLLANGVLLFSVVRHSDSAGRSSRLPVAGKSGAVRGLEAGGTAGGGSSLATDDASATAQELAAIRSLRRLQAAGAALQTKSGSDPRYWQRSSYLGLPSREEMAERNRLRREFSDTLRTAFGPEAALGFIGSSPNAFPYLPPGKQEQLTRILHDYNELQAEVMRDTNGIQLPSDRAKIRLLREEQEKDIAALLTPEEREQYELRSSRTASNIRSRYGSAIETEEDYRKIFAVQKAFDDQFPMEDLIGRPSQEYLRQRSEAERQLQGKFQAALGDARYAAFKQASDQDYQALTSLTARLNLPAGTTTSVLGTRDALAIESQRIIADSSLSPQERRAQIQALGERAKGQVGAVLGTEAADAYLARANWVNHLKNGIAYSTDPKDAPPGMSSLGGTNVYPVIPSGSRISTESRTIITGDSAAGRVSVPMTIIQSTTPPAPPPTPPASTVAPKP